MYSYSQYIPGKSIHSEKEFKYIYVGLFLFFLFCWWANTRDINIEWALKGMSPIDWVNQSFNPDNFVKNFPSGVENMDVSFFMHIYKLAYSYLGINPETLLPFIIGIEIMTMMFAVYMISRTLMPTANRLVAIIVVLLVVSSTAGQMNLARFETTFFKGLYYNIADSLRMFAIVACLRRKPILSATLIAFSFITHPVIGLAGGIFLLAICLTKPSEYVNKYSVIGLLMFGAIVSTWFLSFIDFHSVSSGGIPFQDWFNLTKLNSYHWYPVDYGLFSTEHQERFVPFLSFMLLLTFYISRFQPLRELDRQMISGILALLIITLIGIIISVWKPSPALVKLSLHRANDLVIIIGLVYIVNGLFDELLSDSMLRYVLSFIIMVSPFIMKPGYPLIFSLAIVSPSINSFFRRKGNLTGNLFVSFLAIGIIILIFVYTITGMVRPWFSNAYTGFESIKYVLLLIAVVIISRILVVRFNIKSTLPYVLSITCLLFASNWLYHQRMGSEERIMAQDYKAVQLWANLHTSHDSLFMVDPTIYYGWRDYSQRSSFGNLREWLYSAWIYNSNYKVYSDGIKRFNEFGVDLKPYLETRPPLKGFSKLDDEIRKKYYALADDWRISLARHYGIDYFVMKKSEIVEPSALNAVYENDNFLILDAKKINLSLMKKWHVIFSSNFENLIPEKHGYLSWSTYSEGRPVTWPWGITRASHAGRNALFLKQPDRHDYELYTGQGDITKPPGSSNDDKYLVKGHGTYRIQVSLKGEGVTDIYLWWYDREGKYKNRLLFRYDLRPDYESFVRVFELPKEAKEFRINFLCRKSNEKLSTIFINNFIIEVLDAKYES